MTVKTQAELRHMAMGAARRAIRSQGQDPILASAGDALLVLESLSQTATDDPASHWYMRASNTQRVLFRREWKIWRAHAAAAANAGHPLDEGDA